MSIDFTRQSSSVYKNVTSNEMFANFLELHDGKNPNRPRFLDEDDCIYPDSEDEREEQVLTPQPSPLDNMLDSFENFRDSLKVVDNTIEIQKKMDEVTNDRSIDVCDSIIKLNSLHNAMLKETQKSVNRLFSRLESFAEYEKDKERESKKKKKF